MLKNLLTLGGSSKLEREIKELYYLRDVYMAAGKQYNLLVENRALLFNNLLIERNEAIRNFELTKSLIRVVKNELKSKKTEANKDMLSINVNINNNINQLNNIENIDLTNVIDNSIRNISKSVGQSFDRLSVNFDSKGHLTKQDLKIEALSLGVNLVGEAFTYIENLNKEVSKRRKKVQKHIAILQKHLNRILDSYRNLYAESLRIDEVFQVLNKNNKVFIEKYKSIIEKYFINYDLNKINNKIDNYESNLEQEIKSLMMICSEYKKTTNINIDNKGNK